jgi:hypothetical protein
MDVRAEKNDLERRVRETAELLQGVDQDVTQLATRMGRLEQSKDSKLNNVRHVKGQDFENSGVNLSILAEVESAKSQYLLNAIS